MNINRGITVNQSSRQGYKPELIVCHITEGSLWGAVSWFKNSASQASSHFLVGRKGEVIQLVDITEKAWCNGRILNPSNETVKKYYNSGNKDGNLYTISIEHEGVWKNTKGTLTALQEKATTELIRYIVSEVKRLYGTDIAIDRQHIIGHYEIDSVNKCNCPGWLFPFDRIIQTLSSPTSVKVLDVGKKVQLNRAPLYLSSYGGIAVRNITGNYPITRIISGRGAGVLIGDIGWVRPQDCMVINEISQAPQPAPIQPSVTLPPTERKLDIGSRVKLINAPLYITSYGGFAVGRKTGTFTVTNIKKGRAAGVLINTNMGWVRPQDCIVL